MRSVAVAVFAGLALVSAAIYLKPQPRFAALPIPSAVGRLDTITGEMIVCSGGGCATIRSATVNPLDVLDAPARGGD